MFLKFCHFNVKENLKQFSCFHLLRKKCKHVVFKLYASIYFPPALFLLSWLDDHSGHGARSLAYLMPLTMTKSLITAYGISTLITPGSAVKTLVEGEWVMKAACGGADPNPAASHS